MSRRVYQRKFDRAVAQAMIDSGLSYPAAARALGVTEMAVRRALIPGLAKQMDERSRQAARLRRAR